MRQVNRLECFREFLRRNLGVWINPKIQSLIAGSQQPHKLCVDHIFSDIDPLSYPSRRSPRNPPFQFHILMRFDTARRYPLIPCIEIFHLHYGTNKLTDVIGHIR